MKKEFVYQQGETRIEKIDKLPDGVETKPVKATESGGYIISHSENGNHHILTGGDVKERTNDVPKGLKIIYAILDKPEEFFQDAPDAHEKYELKPGIYAFTNSREYDHFTEQARRVAD
jgi:hypothetical protein